jgi:hypothetical protein
MKAKKATKPKKSAKAMEKKFRTYIVKKSSAQKPPKAGKTIKKPKNRSALGCVAFGCPVVHPDFPNWVIHHCVAEANTIICIYAKA